MWFYSEIFSDNADKARLVTAVLSVIAAVVVVLLNHSLGQRRIRIEQRAKKMEEIYAAVTDLANAGWKYMHERAGQNEQALETMSAYDEAHSKVSMLASIYADDVSGDIAALNELVILTKGGGSEDLSLFPEKLHAFTKAKSDIHRKIAHKARKLV
jgi:hypothetical protein